MDAPINSTMNDRHTPPPFDDTNTDRTPYNAAAEARQRAETEVERRTQEYRICEGRVHDLHEDIQAEYCRTSGMKRPAEAIGFRNRSAALEGVLRGLQALTTDIVMRTSIERDLNTLMCDSYILRANLAELHQQPFQRQTVSPTPNIQNPQPRAAHAETFPVNLRPSMVQPSVRYFDRQVDGLTFNVSNPTQFNDSQPARAADAIQNEAGNATNTQQQPQHSNHVTFGPHTAFVPSSIHTSRGNPSSIQHSSTMRPLDQLNERAPAPQGGPAPHAWPPTTQTNQMGIVNANNRFPMPNVGVPHNASGGTQGTQGSRPYKTTYHPAVSTARYPEYAFDQRDANDSQLTTRQQVSQLPSMNAAQGQQFLSRVLAHRRYDGDTTNNSKNIQLDEFIGHTRSYQTSTGSSDAVVLSQLATFFSGRAFTWWTANQRDIHSLDELEVRLRARFERQAMDELSLLGDFCGHKQRQNEDLLDYIDEMQKKASVCNPPLPEPQIISRIVDNANDTYRSFLATKQYESVSLLQRFAEYLVRSNDVKREARAEQKYWPKKTTTNSRYIHHLEADLDSTEESEMHSSVEEEADVDDAIPTAMVEAIAREMSKWKFGNQKGKPTSKVPQRTNAQYVHENSLVESKTDKVTHNKKPIECYGCGAPGVYRNECERCNPKSKN